MRRAICVLGLVLAFGFAASAQENPKADLSLNYSYLRMNSGSLSNLPAFNFQGGEASFAYNFSPMLGVVADFGGYHNGTASANLYSYMFGPRVTLRGTHKIEPYGQVLLGAMRDGSHLFSATTSSNAFALSVGGGFDLKANPHFAIRLGQVEYLMTRFNEFGQGFQPIRQNNLRISSGIVFRW